MCLIYLAEDESDSHLVCCGNLHAYAAAMAFSIFDFLAVIITLIVYGICAKESLDWTNIVPICALIISICVFPIGPVALLEQSAFKLRIYRWRLRCIVLYSFLWMIMCLFVQENNVGIVVALVWLLAAIIYLLGSHFCTNALDFLYSYRGYDGADPVIMEQVLQTTKSMAV